MKQIYNKDTYEYKHCTQEEVNNYIIDVLGFEGNELRMEDLNDSQKNECYNYNN